jgi:uncharacterized protein involved in exopolysaccharide biosynthesis
MHETDSLPLIEPAAQATPLSLVVMTALWRNLRLIAWFFVAGLILSVIIALLIPSYYKSTVQLMSPGWQSTNNVLAAPFSASAVSPASATFALGLSSRSPAGPLLGIVKSRTMLDDLISRFDLQRVYHARTIADARKVLDKRINATEDKPTGIISIVVTDRDPVRARDLAAACVDNLNKLVVVMDASAAHQERVFLEQRLKDVQADLESSEQELGHYSNRTGTMDGSVQSKAMLDAVTNVEGQLIAAQSELRGLQTTYSDENTLVQQAKARVATLNAQLEKMEGVHGGGSAESAGDQAYPSLRQLPLLGVTYADLYRRTRTLEVAYELLSRELEASKIKEAEEIPSVKVLDAPIVPQRKSFPPRTLLVAVGVFLSILIGCVWVVNREIWLGIDNANPWKILAQEVAASLPRLWRRS